MKSKIKKCPDCGGNHLYTSRPISSGGGYAPNYRPGLGSMFGSARFSVVLCKDCGLTRFFATPPAIEKIASSSKWNRL